MLGTILDPEHIIAKKAKSLSLCPLQSEGRERTMWGNDKCHRGKKEVNQTCILTGYPHT